MQPKRAWTPFSGPSRPRPPAWRDRRAAFLRSVRGIVLTLLLALSATAAPSANPGVQPIPLPAAEPAAVRQGCLDDVDPEGSGFTPGELSQAASLYRTANRTVDIHRGTLLSAIALAEAYNLTLQVTNVSNFTDERIEVCAFESLATVEGREALLGELVGRGKGPLHLGGARLLTVFRTTTVQNVTLASEVAFAAIALKGSGATVKLDDVLTFQRETRTTRTLERLVNLTDEELLLEIALRGEAETRGRNATAGSDAARQPRLGEELEGKEGSGPPPRGDRDDAGLRPGGVEPPGSRRGLGRRSEALPQLVWPKARRSSRVSAGRPAQMRVPVTGRRASVLFTKATPVRTMPSRRWSTLSGMLIATPSDSRRPGAMKPRSVTTR